ncbi:MAG: GntR family transcriptional regulator [Burkholderiaceae bacterium]
MNAPFDSAARFRLERSRLAAAQIYDHLRDMIISLAVKPGTVLSRPELAAYFDVSITPIRDALQRLEDEHLVEIFPHHVTRVRAIDLQSARQAQFLRQSIELEVVFTLAGKKQPALIGSLRSLITQQEAALDASEFERFVDIDHAFHRKLYAAAGVEDLFDLVRHRSGNLDRLRRLHVPIQGKGKSIIRDHRAIVDAIAAGRPEDAQHQLRSHLSGTLAHLESIRERYPDFLSDG